MSDVRSLSGRSVNTVVMADERAINYGIPAELHGRCKELAAWKGQTLRVWVTRALEAEAERQEADRDEQRRRHRR